MIKYINGNIKNFDIKLDVILNKRKFLQTNQSKNTRLIIQDVKKRGDKALLKYQKKFSKILKNNNKIKFSKKEINDISKKTDPKLKKSIDIALTRIKKFHLKQKFLPFKFWDKYKNELSYKYSPIQMWEFMYLVVQLVILVQC